MYTMQLCRLPAIDICHIQFPSTYACVYTVVVSACPTTDSPCATSGIIAHNGVVYYSLCALNTIVFPNHKWCL